jgi:membrane-associated phospholipid phosphatase
MTDNKVNIMISVDSIILLSVISFLIILLVFTPEILLAQNLDVDILKRINPTCPDSLYWLQVSTSVYWAPTIPTIIYFGYAFFRRNIQVRCRGLKFLLSIGFSQLISEVLKIIINRERPADRYPNEIFVSSTTHDGSFPSGHTAAAFATATILVLENNKWYIVVPTYLWACSVAYSRMYLGKHYPSDVLGGILIGIGSAWLSHTLAKKLFKNSMNSNVYP